jgi:transposase
MWFAGIDWADEHHDLAVVDASGATVATRRVAHSAAGLADLTTCLQQLAARAAQETASAAPVPAEGGAGTAAVALVCLVETDRGLLITALLEAGVPVYPVNPQLVRRHRSASGAKTDARDALILARLGRSDLGTLRRLAPDSPLVTELKALTRDQATLIREQTRLVNRLTSCLKAYWPGALTLFARLQQPVSLAFLQAYPTLEAAQVATLDELTAFFQSRHPRYPAPTAAARVWERLHRPQLVADAVTVRTKARLVLALVGQLLPLLEQIAAYDEEIARLFAQHPDSACFLSLPGAGPRLAPRLLVGWGEDRARYASAASVQALAGTAPVPWQSGKYAHVHMRVACSKPLRNALYRFAWLSTQQEEWARAYYEKKRREGKRHSVAVRALANQWVRVIHAIWRDRSRYDAATFRAAQQAHTGARPAA